MRSAIIRTCTIGATVLLLLLVAGDLTMAQAPHRLHVQLGFGGTPAEGCYNPLFIHLDPTPPPGSTATLTVTLLGSQGFMAGPSRADTPIATAQFDLRFPPLGRGLSVPLLLYDDIKRLRLHLHTADGQQISRTITLPGDRHRPNLVLTKRRDKLAFLREALEPAAFVEPSELPGDWRSYDCVNAIILDDLPLEELPPKALAALQQAVAWGKGLLVTGPGLDTNAASPLLHPLHLDSAQVTSQPRARLPQLEDWFTSAASDAGSMRPVSLSSVRLPDDSAVLVRSHERPLVSRLRLLRSSVLACAFDPADLYWESADLSYKARSACWQQLLSLTDTYRGADLRVVDVVHSLVPAEARIQSQLRPIIILRAVFALALGPINFLLIRRARRREWMLLTVPGAVAVFLIVAAVIFRTTLLPADLLSAETVTWAAADRPQAVELTYFGILPRGQGYQSAELPAEAALYPSSELLRGYLRYMGETPPPVLQAEQIQGPVTIQGIWQRPRAMRFFASGWPIEITPPAAEARLVGETLVGSFTNTFNEELKGLTLVVRWRKLSLGDLPPGETAAFRVPLGPPEVFERADGSPIDYLHPTSWLAVEGSACSIGGCGPTDALSASPEDALLLEATSRAGTAFLHPLLLAWGKRQSPVSSTGALRRDRRLYLITVPLSPLSDRRFSLPTGLLTPSREWVGSYLRVVPDDRSQEGAAHLFTLPVTPGPLADCALTLHAYASVPRWYFGGRGLQLKLLNWHEGRWEDVGSPFLNFAEYRMEQAARFVKQPEGWIAVAYYDPEYYLEDEPSYGGARLTYLDLSLEGSRQ